jgi:hypothetical protein
MHDMVCFKTVKLSHDHFANGGRDDDVLLYLYGFPTRLSDSVHWIDDMTTKNYTGVQGWSKTKVFYFLESQRQQGLVKAMIPPEPAV